MLPAGVRHSKRLFRPCLTGKLGTETQESELKREYEKLELGCRLLLPCGHAVGAEAHCSMTESANSYQSLYLYSGGKSVHVVPCASFVLPTWPCPSTNNNEHPDTGQTGTATGAFVSSCSQPPRHRRQHRQLRSNHGFFRRASSQRRPISIPRYVPQWARGVHLPLCALCARRAEAGPGHITILGLSLRAFALTGK